MSVFIYLFILLLNVIAIAATYHCLGKDMDKKTKGIFIIVGVAAIYILVSFVYWLGTKDIDMMVDADTGKNLIVFAFVPVNCIIILPFLASSYRHFINGELKQAPFRNRCILLAVILVIVLIVEKSYFNDIQNGILAILQSGTGN